MQLGLWLMLKWVLRRSQTQTVQWKVLLSVWQKQFCHFITTAACDLDVFIRCTSHPDRAEIKRILKQSEWHHAAFPLEYEIHLRSHPTVWVIQENILQSISALLCTPYFPCCIPLYHIQHIIGRWNWSLIGGIFEACKYSTINCS